MESNSEDVVEAALGQLHKLVGEDVLTKLCATSAVMMEIGSSVVLARACCFDRTWHSTAVSS